MTRCTVPVAESGDVEALTDDERDVAIAQAVEFAQYVEEHAKGRMVDAAKRFLSLPYSQELARRLASAPQPAAVVPEGWRETAAQAADAIAYSIYNLADEKLSDLPAGLIDATDPASVALLAERKLRAMLAAAPKPEAQPIPMLLFCPRCHAQHIDEPDDRTPGWTNPPHRSHLCHTCGCIWRPADVATVGVAEIETRGAADTFTGAPQPGVDAAMVERAARGICKSKGEDPDAVWIKPVLHQPILNWHHRIDDAMAALTEGLAGQPASAPRGTAHASSDDQCNACKTWPVDGDACQNCGTQRPFGRAPRGGEVGDA